ncbi:MAG: hypothetical protein WC406_04225 [Methanoregula sp.]
MAVVIPIRDITKITKSEKTPKIKPITYMATMTRNEKRILFLNADDIISGKSSRSLSLSRNTKTLSPTIHKAAMMVVTRNESTVYPYSII